MNPRLGIAFYHTRNGFTARPTEPAAYRTVLLEAPHHGVPHHQLITAFEHLFAFAETMINPGGHFDQTKH